MRDSASTATTTAPRLQLLLPRLQLLLPCPRTSTCICHIDIISGSKGNTSNCSHGSTACKASSDTSSACTTKTIYPAQGLDTSLRDISTIEAAPAFHQRTSRGVINRIFRRFFRIPTQLATRHLHHQRVYLAGHQHEDEALSASPTAPTTIPGTTARNDGHHYISLAQYGRTSQLSHASWAGMPLLTAVQH